MDVTTNINMLPDLILAQILEKVRWRERMKCEQVCKKWQNVGKHCSWSNYRNFDNAKIEDFRENEIMQTKPFFDRCGRYLRHMTLRRSTFKAATTFLGMAPNIQHLKFLAIVFPDIVVELAQFLTSLNLLKSLDLKLDKLFCHEDDFEADLGLMESFKAMSCLEYLSINDFAYLFDLHSFVQFPPNLKYFALLRISNGDKILSWVAEGCKHLKALGVSGNINKNAFRAISQMKSLTYLGLSMIPIANDIGYVFEALTQLRALEINTLDEKVIASIAHYCQKLEHLSILDTDEEVSSEMHANALCLASLKNLCSLKFCVRNYSKERATELVNRFIDNGNLQYISVSASKGPLESEVLFEILRRCKSIQYIELGFVKISSDFYTEICQVVDEVNEIGKQLCEFPTDTHQTVELICENYLYNIEPYQWLRFKDEISLPSVREKWQYGWLSAGKPEWTRRHPLISLD